MPRRARIAAESGVYHVIHRGVNRDALFLENEDYDRFLHALALTKAVSGCAVLAYCLMPNHVHLVLSPSDEPLGVVMKRLGVRYVRWFNQKYGRVGHLFQDRFTSIPVETDEYLATLLRYVWNNPVAAGLAARAEDYEWSSRRALEGESELVDATRLKLLVPAEVLDPANASPPPEHNGGPLPPRRRVVNDEVVRVLRRTYGVSGPLEFMRLPLSVQRRAIAELRTRSTSYAQIALATGLTKFGVRQLQATVVQPNE